MSEYPDKLPEGHTWKVGRPIFTTAEMAFVIGLVVGLMLMLITVSLAWGAA